MIYVLLVFYGVVSVIFLAGVANDYIKYPGALKGFLALMVVGLLWPLLIAIALLEAAVDVLFLTAFRGGRK